MTPYEYELLKNRKCFTIPIRCLSMNPAELENGTEVYFETFAGVVFRGTVVGQDVLTEKFTYSNYDDDCNVVRVNIDKTISSTDDELPNHIAPKRVQPSDTEQTSVLRDAYTIDAEEQHYIVSSNNLVEILS